jgi:hypoxanthine phosphoribosyltransferase
MSKILYTELDISTAVINIATELNKKYENSNKPLMLVGVLNGSYMFLSDLSKHIELPCVIEFISVKSYVNNKRTDNLTIIYDGLSNYNLDDYNIVFVEDIVDTGYTIKALIDYITSHYSVSQHDVEVCSLVYKKCNNQTYYVPNYIGFTLTKNLFISGYGMDNNNVDRNLRYISYVDN